MSRAPLETSSGPSDLQPFTLPLLPVSPYLHARLLSRVRFFVTPWTVVHQTPLSMGFPRQEYWSGLPFLPPGDLLDPGNEPASPVLAGGFFTIEPHRVQDQFCITSQV